MATITTLNPTDNGATSRTTINGNFTTLNPTGDVVGTTDTQTLTNKTIDANSNTISNISNAELDTTAGALGGAWQSWTPTITAGSGTFTTVSGSGRYIQIGKTVHFRLTITITTNGTAAGNVSASLPVNAKESNWMCIGRENNVTGDTLQGKGSTTTVSFFSYNNFYPGGDGRSIISSGTYEAA